MYNICFRTLFNTFFSHALLSNNYSSMEHLTSPFGETQTF